MESRKFGSILGALDFWKLSVLDHVQNGYSVLKQTVRILLGTMSLWLGLTRNVDCSSFGVRSQQGAVELLCPDLRGRRCPRLLSVRVKSLL